LRDHPLDAIDVDGRKRAAPGRHVEQRVAERQLSPSRRRSPKTDQAHGELVAGQPRRAGFRVRRSIAVPTYQPGNVDAGSGQDPGRCTQSNRLFRRRHDGGVVHAHLDARTPKSKAAIRVRRRWRNQIGRRHGVDGDAEKPRHHECSRNRVSHHATVRPARKCLNAAEVT